MTWQVKRRLFQDESDLGAVISDSCTEDAVQRHFHERKFLEPMAPIAHNTCPCDVSHLHTVHCSLDFQLILPKKGRHFCPKNCDRTTKYTSWRKPHRDVSLFDTTQEFSLWPIHPIQASPQLPHLSPSGTYYHYSPLVPPFPSGALKWHAAFQMAPDETHCVTSLNLHRAFLNLINQLVTITLNCSVPINVQNFPVFAPNLYNKTICPADNLSTKAHYCCSVTAFIRCGKKSVWVLYYVKDQFRTVALDLMRHLQFKVAWYLSMAHFIIFLFHFIFVPITKECRSTSKTFQDKEPILNGKF